MSQYTPEQVSRAVPAPLAEIIEHFQAVEDRRRLDLLLDYSRRLPPLPAEYHDNYEQMEEVVECQTPLFLAAEFDDADRTAEFFFAAPAEVPATRGFASILQHGLSGQPYEATLQTPEDVVHQLGLGKVIAPMRLRAVGAMFGRLRQKVLDHIS